MSDFKTKYVPISMDYLFSGMRVKDDILNHTGKVILLRQGDVLTHAKLLRLQKFNDDNKSILVSSSTFDYLVENKPTEAKVKKLTADEKMNYSVVIDSTTNFLDTISSSGKVNKTHAVGIQKDISTKIDELDVKDVIDCINAPRPMDEYLQKHIANVGIVNGLIGKWLGLSKSNISALVLAGVLHDLGKTKIDMEILNAPRTLTREEFEEIKLHPRHSYDLIKDDNTLDEKVKHGVLYHHEKMDGSGYPDGLKGDDIPTFARITAVSDIYDAMISKRCYKEAGNPLDVINLFSTGRFSGLDPVVVSLFCLKMTPLFIGSVATLSDGREGTIKYILPNDISHPIVKVDGELIQTSDELRCVGISTDTEVISKQVQ